MTANDRPGAEGDLELTILMPCLNEAETLAVCIEKAKGYLERSGVRGEVLIADNGSDDGSQEIARGLGARVVDVPRRGYGAALIGGIEAARGRFIIMGDADDSYDFARLDAFVEPLRAGAQLVMGNRFKGGIEPGAMPFLHRYLGNPVLSFLGRMFFRIPVGDFHCGLRGFHADAIRSLRLQTTGMEFASEMVVKAALGAVRIEEAPTTLKPDGRSRPPHLRTWRDGWRHLKFLLIYSPRWLFLYPGLLTSGLGAGLTASLLPGPLTLPGGVVMDINAFVAGCFMILAGVQMITFGVLSRRYAAMTGFLPASRTANTLMRHINTERMALLSLALLIAGLLTFGYAFMVWLERGFGPLTDPMIPRLVIGGLALVAVALQTFFSAFLLGTLDIPKLRGPEGP
ncbi:glycosyltransferase family 2 protein [Phenylobacterium sp.]|jgi:glycosyltransferase involved in cell wall biosynthesis|uniref:glycosyltransferase family 2 protein n=1 Tax=Phenylobacterium sp. TaxID=1871053 RepID=UPI002E2EACFC|nr:glycosyltransferase family 2 protein [Phenylobacterium sp.]HEX2561073.1 glycosyltransferase family 2 protein [Phenylobacterium sp.]